MGNQSSSCAPPGASVYQSADLPDSFFNPSPRLGKNPPPYTSSSPAPSPSTAEDLTMIFRSTDGVLFSLRKKDIEAHTGALIPDDGSSRSTVTLPEKSIVLRTLFQFIGPHEHPKLLTEKFEILAEVAKAAEKYKVFSATNICAERMRSHGDRHPKLVMLYAVHNNYPHNLDECAPHVITTENLEYIILLLPEHLRLPWIQYHARWSKALTDIISYSYAVCPWSPWSFCWVACGQIIYQSLATGVNCLNNVALTFDERVGGHTRMCSKCRDFCKAWKSHAEKSIGEIELFSKFYVDNE